MNPSDTLLEPLSFVGYTCPHCPAWSTDPEVARLHCICPIDGCNESRRTDHGSYMIRCPAHLEQMDAERQAARLAEMRAATMEDVSKCPMFYCDNNGQFSDDIDILVDDCRYNDIADADIVIHPCTEDTVGTPGLLEYIDEAWSEEFTDDSFDGPPLSAETRRIVAAAQAALLEDAPVIYRPQATHRVVLAEAG